MSRLCGVGCALSTQHRSYGASESRVGVRLLRSSQVSDLGLPSELDGQVAAQLGHVSGGLDVVLRLGDLAFLVDDER